MLTLLLVIGIILFIKTIDLTRGFNNLAAGMV